MSSNTIYNTQKHLNYQYHYIYKTTNKLNNKIYIGKHSTNDLNDGYIGSGTYLKEDIIKYGKESFTTEILEFFNSEIDALNAELKIVTQEFVNDDMTYNAILGGKGGVTVLYEGHPKYEETCKNISNSVKGLRHWTNGIIDMKCENSPGEGWYIGRAPNDNFKYSDEQIEQAKARQANGESTWWNNGAINKRQKEMPDGDNWVHGRLKSSMPKNFHGKSKYKSVVVKDVNTNEEFEVLWNDEEFKKFGSGFRTNIISRKKYKQLILIKINLN